MYLLPEAPRVELPAASRRFTQVLSHDSQFILRVKVDWSYELELPIELERLGLTECG
jgi:hypothetical protein